MKTVRYGVVGAGWISQIAFLPSVHNSPNSVVTAIISGTSSTAKELAEFHDIPQVYSYDQYDEMLASDVIDAVYIALPNSMHADFAIRALNAGKHALVEKPLAVTLRECESMINAADRNDVYLGTAYRLHHDPENMRIYDRIHAEEIGQPRLFTSVFSFQADSSNHRLTAEHWGGPLQDIGIYCLNAARHIFKAEPIEVSAIMGYGDNDARFSEVHETVAVTLRFTGGRIAQFIASFGAADVDRIHVVGTLGDITIDPAFDFRRDIAWQLRKGEFRAESIADDTDHFGAQATYFSDCIIKSHPPVANGQEGLIDVKIMLAIERAVDTGMPQALDIPIHTRHPSLDTARSIKRTQRRLLL